MEIDNQSQRYIEQFHVAEQLRLMNGMTAVVVVICGVSLTAIDACSGMPRFWTAAEGPFLILAGAVLGWLTGRVGEH